MNNLFHAFKIEIPGVLLDDKMYYQYDDFNSDDPAYPTDAETLEKGIAFTRLQQLQRELSKFEVPVYYTVEFETPGTAGTQPQNAVLHVGYKTFDGFVFSDTVPFDVPFDERLDKAVVELTSVVNDFLEAGIENYYCTLQHTVVRKRFPLATDETSYKETVTEYITVPPAAAVATVTYVKL